MKCVLAGVLLLAVLGLGGAQEDGGARLLASKTVFNQYLVEGKDVTVQYAIYNVGSSAAMNVELSDKQYSAEYYEAVRGLHETRWERVAPGSNVTHNVIVRPIQAGYYNFSAATVSYLASEDATEPTVVYTTAPGEGGVVSFKDFDRKFSPHLLDWCVFLVMTLPSIAIPAMLWYSSKSKYDTGKGKKSH